MDKKIFDELMNRGIITQVGLDSEKYADLIDLQINQIATAIGAQEEYDELMKSEKPAEEELPESSEPATESDPVVE